MPLPIAPVDLNEYLTTEQAASAVGVTTDVIRQWRRRGVLETTGLDERGRPMHRWIDVVRAERATREKARRKYVNAA